MRPRAASSRIKLDDPPLDQRIHAGCRFIQKNYRRVDHQCFRDLQPSFVSAGEGLRARVQMLLQLQRLDHAIHTLAGFGAGIAVQVSVQQKIVERGKQRLDRILLQHRDDVTPHCQRLARDIVSRDKRTAHGRPQDGGQHANGRGLPCPVRPQQTEDLAAAYTEADAVDRDLSLAVNVTKLLDDDDFVRHSGMISESE